MIVGDLNASPVEGEGIRSSIESLVRHASVAQSEAPKSKGGSLNKPESPYASTHTAYWGMRADYVLFSKFGLNVSGSGVFWPTADSDLYRLIKDRESSSDHRLVWVDLKLTGK